ncbi:MAG: hypothetical protein AVDCRST_MAG01-01-2828 [uncultured Rubrobacteraceae bacterium]|uniref:Uncharacterized protein n=1 Tax=uncultured Rubrobacteraceae bacterium TaxID=349277 RepID=A0A6J4Q6Y5_9ACTN|nr:MAG: hypothetical protein AVDCRST_MAG01-01-2828 [uncultured Rubrobacteraceae bacterium]
MRYKALGFRSLARHLAADDDFVPIRADLYQRSASRQPFSA